MAQQIARLIGGAGTGKTTELLRLLEMNLERGVDPLQIGFVSFTRAARRTAAERAADLCGCSSTQLENEGWFRTLHSVCYRGLGCKRDGVLAEDRSSSKWLNENLGEAVGVSLSDEDIAEADFSVTTEAGRALQLWHAARNRTEPLRAIWEQAAAISERTPSYEYCVDVVTRYEQAKRLDGKQDFTDIIGEFAGWSFDVSGHEKCTPQGEAPSLPVWFFDEQQDTSALLDSVCKRLIKSAEHVYLVGDFFQSIYTWAGADARLFLAWEVAKSRTMPKSYRCPAPIHEFGEGILREASDYWDRGIAPADHEGSLEFERFNDSLIAELINPTESWLLLARTNYHANRIAGKLRDAGVPWQPTRGLGGWNKPSTNRGLQGLLDAQNGLPIDPKEWAEVIKLLPSKCLQGELLTRGTKTSFEPIAHKNDQIYAANLFEWGATPLMIDLIRSGNWVHQIDGAAQYVEAVNKYSWRVVNNPPVRVGTVHSVKGDEADNVLWLTSGTKATGKACEDQQGFDDECKVAYVAATRARRRLVVAIEPNDRNRFKIPAGFAA